MGAGFRHYRSRPQIVTEAEKKTLSQTNTPASSTDTDAAADDAALDNGAAALKNDAYNAAKGGDEDKVNWFAELRGLALMLFAVLAAPLGIAAALLRTPEPPAVRDLTPDPDEPDPPGAAL